MLQQCLLFSYKPYMRKFIIDKYTERVYTFLISFIHHDIHYTIAIHDTFQK